MTIRRIFQCYCLLAATVAFSGDLVGREAKTQVKQKGVANTSQQPVEFFAAKDAGTIDVRYIPKDVKQAQVILKNNTDQPVQIKLPEAFAGVPVLAQIGGGGGGGFGGGGQGGGGGGNQGSGGGFGGGGGGQGGGGGGGVFNIAPEKVYRLKVKTICLDHGMADPNPRVPYEIKPIDFYVERPEVIELVKAFGRGEVPIGAAQAAAWHLNNGVSWAELDAKMRGPKDPRFGRQERFFSRKEVQLAVRVAEEALRRTRKEREALAAKQGEAYSSPGEFHSPRE